MAHPRPERMGKGEARRIWRRADLTGEQAIKKMHGWTLGSAYRILKRREVPVGRRHKR